MLRQALAAMLTAALISLAGSAAAETIEDFFGVYVGVTDVMEAGAATEERDVDLEIAEYQSDGFVIGLTVVTKVDGRRDVPGVERRHRELKFRRDGDEWVIDARRSLFTVRRHMDLEEGDEVLQARIEGNVLHIASEFMLQSDEMLVQAFDFTLTEDGLTTHFTREVDGEVVRRTTGTLIRVDN